MRLILQLSREFVVSGLVNTTIPLFWDDPTLPSIVRQPLVAVFDGLGSQTQVQGNEKPSQTVSVSTSGECFPF